MPDDDNIHSEQQPLLNADDDVRRYNDDGDANAAKLANTNQDISRQDFRWICIALWSIVFLGALDTTVVATLLTPIGSYFKKSNQASYLGTSYLLSVCCFTPLYGRLSDILGRKGALLLAMSLFIGGTILCGISTSMGMLIAARTIAGMGGGGVMTVSNITMSDIIPLKQRGLYQGYVNILFGVGAGLGGPLGGFLNDQFGWRSPFLVQVPLLLVSFAIVYFKVNVKLSTDIQNEPLQSKLKKIDFLGSATLVGAVSTVLLGFSLKTNEELPWSSPIIVGLFVASAILWILFVATEAFWASHPVMPLRMVTRRTTLASGLANFFGSMTALSMLYNLPLYFSAVRLESATNSGLHLLPNSGAVGFGSILAGVLMRYTGKYYWLTLAFASLGLATNISVSMWNKETSQFHLWADVIGQGASFAGVLTTSLIAIIATVSKEDMAIATGITYLFRYTGQVLGVSLTGAALQSILISKLRERIQGPGAADIIERIRHDTAIIRSLDPQTKQAAIDSYADALRIIFIAQATCSLLSLFFCTFIEEYPLPGTKEEEQEHHRRINAREESSEGHA